MAHEKNFFILKISFLICSFFYLLATGIAEELPLSAGQKQFENLDQETVDLILKNSLSTELTKIRPKTQIYPAEKDVSDFWLGNRPYLSAEIDSIAVSFDALPPGAKKELPLNINLTLTDSEIVIRHSRPYFKRQLGGIRVAGTDNSKPHRFFFRTKDGTSLVVLIPAYSKIEHNRGIVLCPRDFDLTGTREERSKLSPVDWAVDKVQLEVGGDVRGSVRSSIDMVKARAEILTSPAVTPSVAWQDQIFSKNAGVSLYYKPRANFEGYQSSENQRVEGIEVNVDLHANTGYRRISRLQALFYVVPVEMPAFELPVPLKDLVGTAIEAELRQRRIDLEERMVINVDVRAGQCYLVLNNAGTIIHEYLKEPLQPPQKD